MNGRPDYPTRRPMQGPPPAGRPPQYVRSPQEEPSLPRDYLANGYFDASGNLLPEVVIDWPMTLASKLRQQRMASSQFRGFFNSARALEARHRSGVINFGRVKEELRVLQTLAAASVGRKNAPRLFLDMFEANVKATVASDSDEAFSRGFMTHMQSVVAYLKYYESI